MMFSSFKNPRFNKLIVSIFAGLCVLVFAPPEGVTPQAWHLFALFLSTIVAIVMGALPMGEASIIALCVAVASGTLPFEKAFSGYSNEVVWLVFVAFFIAHGFSSTGLGRRIAYVFMALLGRNTIGLAYGISLSELALAPAIPSVTARTGGIIYPIVCSVAEAFNSRPHDGTNRKLGAYLILVSYHAAVVTCAMFLTAMAANPLVAKLATELGEPISWMTWAKGAFLPGMLSLVLVPLLLYLLYKPELTKTPEASAFAKDALHKMGPMSRDEKVMLTTMIALLFMWIFGSVIGISATLAALIGLSVLLIFRALKWEELLKLHQAFETFIWFGALVALAEGLKNYGLADWYGHFAASFLGDMHYAVATFALFLIYFFTHYFFASSTAHVGALFLPFVAVCFELGAPRLPVVLLFAYGSNLMGTLTHYGLSAAPLLFGSGYVPLKVWWRVGLIMGLIHIVLWSSVGFVWWKFLGYF